jgi:SAM-dependent methyltransferase
MMTKPIRVQDARWREWEQRQQVELDACRNPNEFLKSYSNQVAEHFGLFCGFRGYVLDIGCGIDREPAYLCHSTPDLFVGVDPLAGDEPRRYQFVQAIGESLPFRDNVFHQCVFATSLSHIIDPQVAIGEAERVLRFDGSIILWIGLHDPRLVVSRRMSVSFQQQNVSGVKSMSSQRSGVGHLQRLIKRKRYDKLLLKGISFLFHSPRLAFIELRLRLFVNRVFHIPLDDKHCHYFCEGDVYSLIEQCNFKPVRRLLLDNSLFVEARKVASRVELGAV